MARTVPASITPPQRYAVARVPIIDTDGDGRGLKHHAETLNALYEYQRCNCIHDIGGKIAGSLSDTAGDVLYYRTKTMGFGGLSDESGIAAISAVVEDLGDVDPTAAEITFTCGASSAAWNYSSDLGTISPFLPEFIELDGFTVPDNAEYVESTLELVSDGASGDVVVQIFGISMGYARDKTALTAGVYSNGVVPHDAAQYANGRPVSTPRLQSMHGNAISAWERRVGQIVASAWAPTEYVEEAWAIQRVPHTRDGANITARFHTRCAKQSLASATTAQITAYVASADNSVATSPLSLSSTAHSWKESDLSIPTPRMGESPRYAIFRVAGTNFDVSSFCGWWRDRNYA